MKTLYNEVKRYLIDEIENYELEYEYARRLSYMLTERLLVDGTVEYNTQTTVEKIAENYKEYSEVFEYLKDNWGEKPNPFEDPGLLDALAYQVISGYILSKIDILDKNWNEKITLTKELIDIIIDEIKSDTQCYFEY